MKKFLAVIVRRLREFAYLLLSFPVSVALLIVVITGLSSSALFPITAIVVLATLSLMQYIAAFEIKRTNAILGTDFEIASNWFEKKFFSWDGAKERVTSIRSWLAVLYVFISFGWSLLSFVIATCAIVGIFLLLGAVGVTILSPFTHTFEIQDNGDWLKGEISYVSNHGQFRLNLGDSSNHAFLNWNIGSYWVLALAIAAILCAIWLIPRNARAMAKLIDELLSGKAIPEIQSRLNRKLNSKVVSDSSVDQAMAAPNMSAKLDSLTNREREILALIAKGKSNAGIAKSLYINEGSVEKHISNILAKLELTLEVDNHRRVLAVLTYLGLGND